MWRVFKRFGGEVVHVGTLALQAKGISCFGWEVRQRQRIFVAEKWVDSVVSVERHSERALVLKMVLGDCLLNVFMVYASHSGKPDEEKERFWYEVFHLVSCIPQNEMVVFAGDMKGISEVVMLAMVGHVVVLDTALGTLMGPGYWSLQMG